MEVGALAAGIYPSSLPQHFDGEFSLFAYHGAHSRLIFRSVSLKGVPDDDDNVDELMAFPTVDVAFVGVRSTAVDVSMPNGLSIPNATAAEASQIIGDDARDEGDRLYNLGVPERWVLAQGVWWTKETLPFLAPSPLLADLDFTQSEFSWQTSGWTVFHAK